MVNKRQSPGIGHNGNLPAHGDVRTAMAIELIFAEQKKVLNERHKRARKKIEGMGIPLSTLGFLKEAEGMTGSELEQHFRLHWHLAGAIHEDVHEQLDIFQPKPSAPEKRAAHFTMGLMAGLKGLEFTPPPMVAGDDLQQMTKGYEEGRDRRQAAEAQLSEVETAPAEAKTGKAQAVGKKAAEDFAKDQGDDPLVVDGIKHSSIRLANAARKRLEASKPPVTVDADPAADGPFWATFPEDYEAWGSIQKQAFADWFEALPYGEAPIQIDHAGAQTGFLMLRQAADQVVVVSDGGEGLLPEENQAPVVDDDNPPWTAADHANAAPGSEVLPEEVVAAFNKKTPVLKPDFYSWSDNWLEWTGPQTMEFRRWVESLPDDHVPAIAHEGAVTYFNLIREEQANKASGGDDEWDKAAPGPQTAETPDPKEVEAAAQRLKDSGFVPEKGARRRKATV